MIKLHHYSEEKYTGFPEEKQVKVLLELLCALESNIRDDSYRSVLIPHLLECFQWSQPAVKAKFRSLSGLSSNAPPHDIVRLILPLITKLKAKYNDYDTEVHRFDGVVPQPQTGVPYPLTVILDNLRSAHNVGSIFRTAECVQAVQICLCGTTPAPPHPKISRTAMQTQERVNWKYYSDTKDAISELKSCGMPVIALETAPKAKSLFDYKPNCPVAVILGNEALGIEEAILKLADEVLYIPVYGWKNSLNVSNAFTLAAYHLSGIV